MSEIDHAAEAVRLAEIADTSYGRIEHRNGSGGVSEGVEALLVAHVAQVNATLALVAATEKVAEQTRISNLIALNIVSSELGRATAAEIGMEVSGLLADERVRKELGL